MRRPRLRLRGSALVPVLIVISVVTAIVTLALTESAPPTTTAAASKPAPATDPSTPAYSTFLDEMDKHQVESATVDSSTGKAEIQLANGFQGSVVLPADDAALLRQLADSGAVVRLTAPKSSSSSSGSALAALLVPLGLMVLLVGAFWFVRRRSAAGGGSAGVPDMSLRSGVKLSSIPVERFKDVAGCDEAVEELQEIVQFFRDPQLFAHLGAKLPSGVMLHGEPGTGKTLLAKALAGEAGIPFFATSGSDFVEKFVGVGASRVRELFAKARQHPEGAVIFIDEIDAVGRARSGHEANSEREQTLNQILVELDGFSTTDRIVCIAATNRLDVLDPALLRPGRFGRHIAVPLPAAPGRAEILRVHSAGKPLADEVDLAELAETMGGLSGAQLAEVVNEAAIMAGRGGAMQIRRTDFREAFLRVLAGPKRRNAPLADGELEVIAAHEAGHVLCAELSERYEKAQQVTVEPRGQAMGLAVYGQVDRALHDPEYLHEALMATLAGRAAEQLVFGRISSGAANDLQKATELARRAVEELGFSSRVGQIVAGNAPFAETTRTIIDAEIERMVAEAYNDALDRLASRRDALDRLTESLVRSRELERVDIVAAIERRPRLVPTPAAAPDELPLAAAKQARL